LQNFGVGHLPWLWTVRQDPRIAAIFSHLWDTPAEDLLVSFDAMSLHFPPETTKRGWYEGRDWLHTDQSAYKQGLQCIQGWVNMYDTEEGDATLCVLESSHRQHEAFFHDRQAQGKAATAADSDWYRLADEVEHEFFADRGCARVGVKCRRGSVVLWDSRLFHQGIEPLPSRAEARMRMVAYVCMTPREWADPGKPLFEW
jgi:hypothetical protein